ncbi:MAG: nucleotidyltransferase domain-containing protein, partial [Alphaproteobacteria bacterium]
RGDNREKSDIDIAILCPNATDVDWRKVTDIIEDADTLLKIDCLKFDKDELSDVLYQNILKDKKVLYVKE